MKDHKKTIITLFIFGIILTSSLFIGCIENRESIVVNNQKRTFLIHIPSSYESETPVPLVIVLHGGGGNAQNIEDVTGFTIKSEEEGFIVVYPDGTGKLDYRLLTWNAGFCCGYALENQIDDVAYIRYLIKHLQSLYSIDSNKIYVTGISNGGMMTYRIASELSDLIAAAAPIAGSIGGQPREQEKIWRIPKPVNPVSIISFHGMNDTRVPYYGGRPIENNTKGAYSYISVNESISFWIYHNNCTYVPITNISESGNIIVKTYKEGINHTETVLYTIVNGNHSWPGGKKGYRKGDEPIEEISATDIIWEFFKDHPKT